MRIQVVTRHTEVSDAVRDRTEKLLQKLTKYESRLTSAEVVFQEHKRGKEIEGILSVDAGEPVVAKGEGDTFENALDQLVSRLGRILRNRHSRRRDHQAPKMSEVEWEESQAAEGTKTEDG